MKKTSIFLGILAALLFALSFVSPGWQFTLSRTVRQTERGIIKKQTELYGRVEKELKAHSNSCMELELPEDEVLYKYHNDSLLSWVNRFPIRNDDISGNEGPERRPLSSLGNGKWQYMNFGNDWYLVLKSTSEDLQTVIVAGLRLDLKLPSGLCHTTLMEYPAGAVRDMDGEPLFSIGPDRSSKSAPSHLEMKWLALFLAALSLIMAHWSSKSFRSLAIATAGMVLLRLAALYISSNTDSENSIFSPLVYAGNVLSPSLADFFLNNVLIASIICLLYSMRRKVGSAMIRGNYRALWAGAAWTVSALLAIYIRNSFKSIIFNSSITLEPCWIHKFDTSSLLCYLSFALLTLSLMFSLQTALRFSFRKPRLKLFSWKGMAVCSALFSLYFVAAEGDFGLKKEFGRNRIATSKLTMRRDVRMELHLRRVEDGLENESPVWAFAEKSIGNELIRSKIAEKYFSGYDLGQYDISVAFLMADSRDAEENSTTLPPEFAYLEDGSGIYSYPVEGSRRFSFIETSEGKDFYLGKFPRFDPERGLFTCMYLEVRNKRLHRPGFIPARYSYAIYSGGKLIESDGEHAYSASSPQGYLDGYSMVMKDKYIHFINVVSEDTVTVISRHYKQILPYIVSFSYLFIFFLLFFSLCSPGHDRGERLYLPKHSIKRKITFIICGTMMVALSSLGIASVAYNVQERNLEQQLLMDSRMSTIRNAFEGSGGAVPENLGRIASLVDSDISVFDLHGRLVCRSHALGRSRGDEYNRINSKALHSIVHLNEVKCVVEEKQGNRESKYLYAPFRNSDGESAGIIGIAFPRGSSREDDSYTSVVMIINLYIILLLASLVIGVILSNSMLKPLKTLREKLDNLTISPGRNKHIHYKDSKDEIGMLVKSYNEMVDALEESSRKLAQNERELAWKEMARQIAHDIKNPLTPMKLSIQYLDRLRKQNAPGWEEKAGSIGKSLIEKIDALADIASQFSNIASASSAEEARETDLDEFMREQITLFDSNENITLVYDCKLDNPVIKVRSKQLSRVIINLLTNSIQAISGDRGSGNIRITLSEEKGEEENYYRLDFEDDGPGVSRENLDKLFTPNFTTKSSGSGLGLAICRSIVEQEGGSISYSASKKLGGACFSILFKR